MQKANETQVAGEHYKQAGKHQHWDFAADNRLGYFEGQITKYITRWRRKNGMQDLQKALHFADKLYELMTTDGYVSPQLRVSRLWGVIGYPEFAKANQLAMDEGRVCILLCNYQTAKDVGDIRVIIQSIIDKEKASQAEGELQGYGHGV